MKIQIRDWRGPDVIRRKDKGIESGLGKGASYTLTESTNIAPYDQGTLTQTADFDVDPGQGKANVYYVQKYASRLHENPQYNFQGGREGKFLEKVVVRDNQKIRNIIADEIKNQLGG